MYDPLVVGKRGKEGKNGGEEIKNLHLKNSQLNLNVRTDVHLIAKEFSSCTTTNYNEEDENHDNHDDLIRTMAFLGDIATN